MNRVWSLFRFPSADFSGGSVHCFALGGDGAIVVWVGGVLDDYLGPRYGWGGSRRVGLRFAANETTAYILGWVLVLAVIFGVGLLVEFG